MSKSAAPAPAHGGLTQSVTMSASGSAAAKSPLANTPSPRRAVAFQGGSGFSGDTFAAPAMGGLQDGGVLDKSGAGLQETRYLKVDDLRAGQQEVHRIVSAAQGQIVAEQPHGGESVSLEVKVPADRYASTLVYLFQIPSQQKRAIQPAAALPSHSTQVQNASPAAVLASQSATSQQQERDASKTPTRSKTAMRSRDMEKEAQHRETKPSDTVLHKEATILKKEATVPMRILHITLEQKHKAKE